MTIIKRLVKGSELTHAELDGNFTDLDERLSALSGRSIAAWVRFNGTGTVSILASFNVSSITDHGTGFYSLNFTNPLPDASYGFSGMAGKTLDGGGGSMAAIWVLTGSDVKAESLKFYTAYQNSLGGGAGALDCDIVSVVIFR